MYRRALTAPHGQIARLFRGRSHFDCGWYLRLIRLKVVSSYSDNTPVTLDSQREYATGGSARSQAISLEERAWRPRRVMTLAIRAVLILTPIAAGVAAVKGVGVAWARPESTAMFWVWLVGLIGSALISSMLVQRVMSRFVPLTFLFNLSLVFPDRAPSRFKTAMRSMSGKTLERRINEGNADVSDHQASAEEMVALLARLSRHDRVTRGHSERVRAYSIMLGEEIGLSPDELERLNWAALIHDIGKLEVPYEVLNKEGKAQRHRVGDATPTSGGGSVLHRAPPAVVGRLG